MDGGATALYLHIVSADLDVQVDFTLEQSFAMVIEMLGMLDMALSEIAGPCAIPETCERFEKLSPAILGHFTRARGRS